jgi:hypothetical protein
MAAAVGLSRREPVNIAAWLRGLRLQRYEAVFRENEIDRDVLPELEESDLEKRGIPLGPRKLLLGCSRFQLVFSFDQRRIIPVLQQ